MIWFFLAGFISGAVGMILYARWWVIRHMVVRQYNPKDKKEEESHE